MSYKKDGERKKNMQLKPRGNKMETTLKERQHSTILCDLYIKGLLVLKDYPIYYFLEDNCSEQNRY